MIPRAKKTEDLIMEIPVWDHTDQAYGPGCETPERMNHLTAVLRSVMERIQALEDELDFLKSR